MAIEANPQAAFQAGFQLSDNSQRAWQELALKQQEAQRIQIAQGRAAAQQAVENAREQQAFDWKRQLEVLRDGRQVREDQRQAEYQRAQIANQQYQGQTGRYNAATSRYEAGLRGRQLQQQSRNYGDPYGLGGNQDYPNPEMDIPQVPDPAGGFQFGGRSYGQNWGPSGVSVFGGGNDPEDNGLSAFGGRTGAGGREGVAVPESVLRQTLGNDRNAWENAQAQVTLRDGTVKNLPVADLGTAEHVWQRAGGPVLDLTPGAVNALGGQVVTGKNGQQQGVRNVDIANVRVLPAGSQEMVPVADAPPDLPVPQEPLPWQDTAAASVNSAVLDLPVPPVPRVTEPPLLPPPAEMPSIGQTDLTQGISNQLFQLQRDNQMLATQGAQAKNRAMGLQRVLPRVAPGLQDKYLSEIENANTVAQKSAAQGFAASRELNRMEKSLPGLQKRQDALMTLTPLDGVLPPQEVQQLVQEAGDVRTGGAADRKINVLSQYQKVRDQQGLGYLSRGINTAEQVARTGAQMATTEGIKARADAQTYAVLQDALKENPDMDSKTKATYQKDILKLTSGNETWKRMQADFGKAVQADQAPLPTVDGVTEQPPAVAAPVDIFSLRATPAPKGVMTEEEKQTWTQAKDTLRKKLGGEAGIEGSQYIRNSQSLADLKQKLRGALWKVARPDGIGDSISDQTLSPWDIGLDALPKNAKKPEDVLNALAEDIWKATGRGVSDRVVAGTPGISPEGRVKAQELLQKISK